MLLKTSSSTIVYSSVDYDSLQTEHYCKLNALELCLLHSVHQWHIFLHSVSYHDILIMHSIS